MLIVAAIACCLATTRMLGLVLGAFLAVLVSCYVLASALPVQGRAGCGTLSSVFALLPWLGLGHGSFVLMGNPDRLLPTIELPEGVCAALAWVYWIAETPLYVISEYSHELADVICFAGEGLVIVRPFVVFVFWSGFAAVFALSMFSGLLARNETTRKKRPDSEDPI
jgi:hypothetical protein